MLQTMHLTGHQNRTDSHRKKDFQGTLEERRRQYHARREAQGTAATKVIEKMRADEGLDKAREVVNDAAPDGLVRLRRVAIARPHTCAAVRRCGLLLHDPVPACVICQSLRVRVCHWTSLGHRSRHHTLRLCAG